MAEGTAAAQAAAVAPCLTSAGNGGGPALHSHTEEGVGRQDEGEGVRRNEEGEGMGSRGEGQAEEEGAPHPPLGSVIRALVWTAVGNRVGRVAVKTLSKKLTVGGAAWGRALMVLGWVGGGCTVHRRCDNTTVIVTITTVTTVTTITALASFVSSPHGR